MQLTDYLQQAYNLVDQMCVSGSNQDLAYMAKSTLQKAYHIAKSQEVNTNGGTGQTSTGPDA